MKKKVLIFFLLVGGLCFYTAIPASALLLGFDNITNNNPGDAAIGEAQLFVKVTDPGSNQGSNQVLFTFGNTGPAASSICDVYFDDGSLFKFASIDNSDSGVSFSQFAKPGNLPGANNASPRFVTTTGFSFDSDAPVQRNGVNPGETLGITFGLESSTFANVESSLTNGDLRIGIHVQGFESGGSESFVNNPVPEPATMLLFGCGLIGLAAVGRKKFQQRNIK